mmetsp:Transcript_47393/g.120982  ORF Transcript_47393/g.120982 Transcript_47393/m.120982 type:complete len:227 (-) Transcript_47393:205-885(-)
MPPHLPATVLRNCLAVISNDVFRHVVPVLGKPLCQLIVGGGNDLHCKDGRVVSTVSADSGNRHARWHLDDGQKAVIRNLATARHPNHRPAAHGGQDTRQCGRNTGHANEDLAPIRLGGLDNALQVFGSTVSAGHTELVRHSEVLQDLNCLLSDGQIGARAKDDADFDLALRLDSLRERPGRHAPGATAVHGELGTPRKAAGTGGADKLGLHRSDRSELDGRGSRLA